MSAENAAPAGFQIVEEGAARILFPSENQVFYNRPQVVNRDMSTLVIRHFIEMRKREINARAEARRLRAAGGVEPAAANAEEEHDSEPDTASVAQPERDMSFQGVSILEALSATGLRAVRYAKELDDVRVIVANDCSASAVEAIARNAQFNGTHIDDKAATGKAECVIQPNLADAIDLMMQSRQPAKQFDVIDLDPYGTAAIFLDSATQAISEGGLLCVTCTDMAVLCGSGAEAGFAKYGAYSLRTPFCHEQALRIVLGCIQTHAARHKRFIVPLLSLSIDFYVRVFVRVYSSASIVKQSAAKLANLYACTGCDHFQLHRLGKISQRAGAKGGVSTRYHAAATAPSGTANASPPQQCPHCAFPFQIGGPVFAEPIHHAPFVEKLIESVLSTSPELRALCPMPEPLSAPAPAPPTEPAVDGVTMVAPTVSNAALQHLAAIADLPVLVPKKPFAAAKRLLSLLSLAAQELPDAPFYYATNSLFSTLHMSTRKTSVIRSALLNAGYRVSQTHASVMGLKTNAPCEFVYDIMRSLHQEQVNDSTFKAPAPTTPAAAILSKASSAQPNFTEVEFSPRYHALAKFMPNPEDGWGPKARASGAALGIEAAPKRGKASSPQKEQKRRKIDVPCKNFNAGSCAFGDSCKYRHDPKPEL